MDLATMINCTVIGFLHRGCGKYVQTHKDKLGRVIGVAMMYVTASAHDEVASVTLTLAHF